MFRQRRATPLFSERTLFLIVFGLISVVLFASSVGVVAWIRGQLDVLTPAAASSPIYTNYSPAPANYLKPESLAAMAKYIAENPQPQNVKVLQGLTTAQISSYMVGQVAGGLKVDCTYCHNLANGNFAEEANLPMVEGQNIPRKELSRSMMLMAADLNQEWISQLPASVGNKQITCATCHNGLPANLNGYPSTGALSNYPADQSPLSDSYVLPLDLTYPGGLTVTNELNPATGRATGDLGKVELNQNTMYHMNASLGVGCAFCHNARYFPSNERAQKGHAIIMLRMAQDINGQYRSIMNNKGPSCWMCHRGQQLPPGSANEGQVPAMLSSTP